MISNIVDLVKLWTCRDPDEGFLVSVASYCLVWTLWSLWCCDFTSRFCLFVSSQWCFVVSILFNLIPLQRPNNERGLRVGGISRFTSRIICYIILQQTKSTEHFQCFPCCRSRTFALCWSSGRHLCKLLWINCSLFSLCAVGIAISQCGRMNDRWDVLARIFSAWFPLNDSVVCFLPRRHFPSDGGADETFTVSRSLIELALCNSVFSNDFWWMFWSVLSLLSFTCSLWTVTQPVVLKAGYRIYNGLQCNNCWCLSFWNPFCTSMLSNVPYDFCECSKITQKTEDLNEWKNISYLLFLLLFQQRFSQMNRAAKMVWKFGKDKQANEWRSPNGNVIMSDRRGFWKTSTVCRSKRQKAGSM